MFPCVLKCQSVSEGIYTLIAHTKIWLESFNDSAVPQMGPGLASPVANRTVIHISKALRIRQGSLIHRGKCWMDMEGHCVLPPPPSDESRCLGWTKLRHKHPLSFQTYDRRDGAGGRTQITEGPLVHRHTLKQRKWRTPMRRDKGELGSRKGVTVRGKRERRGVSTGKMEAPVPMPLPRKTRTNAIIWECSVIFIIWIVKNSSMIWTIKTQ